MKKIISTQSRRYDGGYVTRGCSERRLHGLVTCP